MPIRVAAKRIIASERFRLFVRFSLGAVFVYAGFIKLLDPKAFGKVISLYDIVPESLLPVIAIGLPAVELLAGLGLIFNVRGSLSVVLGLLLIFCAVLGYGILNDLNIDCGCFTQDDISRQNGLKLAFYRDLIMIGAVCFLFLSRVLHPAPHAETKLIEKLRSLKGRF